jgi:hypothetical protein
MGGEEADAVRTRLIEVAPRYVSEGRRRAKVSNRRVSPADVRVLLPVALKSEEAVSTVAQQ